jgi:RNA polymerase sigma factor (sigma-70 family)
MSVNALKEIPSARERAGIDDDQLCALYRKLFSELVYYVARRTNDSELAEDIAQEALLKVLYNDNFDWSRPVWPWLKITVTRLIITHARRADRERIREVHDFEAEPLLPLEEEMVLAEAISRLPKRQRIALSLHYLEGWRSADAASFLGLTRPAFKQLLTRARGRLRLEYRRLSRGASALLPMRLLRRAGHQASAQHNRANEALKSFVQVGADAASQLVSGLLALVVTAAPLQQPPPLLGAWEPAGAVIRSERDHPRSDGKRDASSLKAVPRHGADVSGDPSDSGSGKGDSTTDPVEDLTEPNKNVRQPEDASIMSMEFVPGDPKHHTAFASGRAHCRLQPCPPVLFHTVDGGESWSRLPAKGLTGVWLAIPPGYGVNHRQIFAMGEAGLQVSDDGGRSFRLAASMGASFARGSIAVSPSFDEGDPTILIGAQVLMRYDDGRHTIQPEPKTALRGPFEPTFAPNYPEDERILLGGLNPSPLGVESTVFVCEQSMCEYLPLPSEEVIPKLVAAPSFASDGLLYAFTENGLYSWQTGRGAFGRIPVPWTSTLSDVKLSPQGGVLFAAVRPQEGDAQSRDLGLYTSNDDGRSWRRKADPLLDGGVSAIALFGGRILVSLHGNGLACSSDGGRRWATRC